MNKTICYVDLFSWQDGMWIRFISEFQTPTAEFELISLLLVFSWSVILKFQFFPNSAIQLADSIMVGVAQLVEPQVVALVVVGSSPITHPIYKFKTGQGISARLFASG